jgi:uncharacterized membrane protein YedE/YeeE
MQTVSAEDLSTLRAIVLFATFALSFVFGAVAQRLGFCTMGAIADAVTFGDTTRLRQWVFAICTAVLGTQALVALGAIDTADSIYTSARFTWLAYLVGGLCFGFGMVLAGGCGSRTLIRIGGGNLKSLVVFFVLGLTAFITLKGALALFRVGTIEPAGIQFGSTQDLPALIGVSLGLAPSIAHAAIGAAAALLAAFWVLQLPAFRTTENVLGSAALGAIVVGVWYVSGHVGHLAEHPLTLESTYVATASGRMESLTFVAPIAHTLDWLMFASDKSKVLTLGVVAVLGTIAGSAAQAIIARRFRWEGFSNTEDTANHIIGAILMGFGGITALGCTIGQGIAGLSTLALGSFLAFGAIVVGAIAGVRYQEWRVGHQG